MTRQTYALLLAMRSSLGPVLTITAMVTWQLATSPAEAQTISGVTRVSVGAWSDPFDVKKADALIEKMIDSGDLSLEATHGDIQIPGRQHEGFVQVFRGIPVYGANISRQTDRGATVSIFGSIYTGIDVDPNPIFSVSDVAALQSQSISLASRQPARPPARAGPAIRLSFPCRLTAYDIPRRGR